MSTGTQASAVQDLPGTIHELQHWVESHDYKGYEPFDGLSSWLRPLTFEKEFPLRLLQQFVRQSPLNVRPLVGVPRKDSTKGRGYMAWGYLVRYGTHRRQEDLDKAIACLRWLDQHKVPRFAHHSWSNHFDFAGRGGTYTRDDPIIVWTSLIGHAYVEAFEATGDEWFLRIARSACDWIMELPRERTASGDCLSYLADRQVTIHNANMLGAGFLARTAKHCANDEYRRVARSAMEYSCTRQRANGSWWYAEEDKFHWIDNFHTGYNLDSLKHYLEATGDDAFRPNLNRGSNFSSGTFSKVTVARSTTTTGRIRWTSSAPRRRSTRWRCSARPRPSALRWGRRSRPGRSATCAIAGAFSTIANTRSSRRRHRCCTGARRRCSRDSASSSTRSTRPPGIASLRRLFVPMQPSHPQSGETS